MNKLLPMKELLLMAERSSLEGNYSAIGAFNVNFYAQAEGILEGLRRANSPGIIQASKGACKFQGSPEKVRDMVLRNMNKKDIVALHLDHGDVQNAINCIQGGFSGVMIDASHLSDLENIAITREIVKIANKKNVSIEGEIGRLTGIEEDIESRFTVYADPLFVPVFFNRTKVDALAIAYGTSHGLNKGNTAALDTSIVDRSYKMMVAAGQNLDHFLVGHGSSTIPIELVDEINRYGGKLKETSGVPMEKIHEGIRYGLRKINIDADLRLGITATFRKYFEENPNVEEKSPALGLIKKVFTGKIPAKDKDGNPVDPGELTDPRSYLQPLMDKSPEMLRKDYRKFEDEKFAEVMELVKERVSGQVEYLTEKFGARNLIKR
jgi:fructose-bisphosphate aldolase, class II